MSVPHRGLPPPPAMSLTPQQAPAPHPPVHPPSHQPPPPVHHSQQPPMPPQSHPPPHPPPHPATHPAPHPAPLHHHRDSWAATSAPPPPTSLPPPPHHWSTSDESMRFWLQARTEEERTRQEQEKTRQEGLRLEQRKIESDMLNSSLNGGIPPPMIPLVFTGMASGGVLPQAALDWAQQYMASQSQYHQLPAPPRPISPESHREAAAQSSASYHPPNLPPPVQGGTYAAYATSPTRPRGSTVSGQMTRPAAGSTISSAGSNTPQSAGLQPSTSTLGPFPPHQSGAGQSSQQDSQLFFHHWQPPVTQPGQSSGASNRPSSPAGESHKKRKAGADSSHHSRTSSTQRPRSPPPLSQRDFGGAPARRLHKRHKSDVSWYHGPRHGMGSSHDSAHRARTPAQDNSSTSSKDRELAEGSRRDSQPETYSRPRHEDEGQSRDRQREREREPTTGPGERTA